MGESGGGNYEGAMRLMKREALAKCTRDAIKYVI